MHKRVYGQAYTVIHTQQELQDPHITNKKESVTHARPFSSDTHGSWKTSRLLLGRWRWWRSLCGPDLFSCSLADSHLYTPVVLHRPGLAGLHSRLRTAWTWQCAMSRAALMTPVHIAPSLSLNSRLFPFFEFYLLSFIFSFLLRLSLYNGRACTLYPPTVVAVRREFPSPSLSCTLSFVLNLIAFISSFSTFILLSSIYLFILTIQKQFSLRSVSRQLSVTLSLRHVPSPDVSSRVSPVFAAYIYREQVGEPEATKKGTKPTRRRLLEKEWWLLRLCIYKANPPGLTNRRWDVTELCGNKKTILIERGGR